MAAKHKHKPILIELVGLPGAGKSTVVKELEKTGRVQPFNQLLRQAAGSWMATELLRKPFTQPLLANELALRFYMGRHKGNLRAYCRYNYALVDSVTRWLTRARDVSSLRYLEHIGTFYNVLSKQYLLDHYADTDEKYVIDEHWINLFCFMLNWGSESEWLKWVDETLDHIEPPTAVIWMNDVADISEVRQKARGRFAPLFHECSNIAEFGSTLETRFSKAKEILEKRKIKLVEVNAKRDVSSIMPPILDTLG